VLGGDIRAAHSDTDDGSNNVNVVEFDVRLVFVPREMHFELMLLKNP
jgi:hypothetical protein